MAQKKDWAVLIRSTVLNDTSERYVQIGDIVGFKEWTTGYGQFSIHELANYVVVKMEKLTWDEMDALRTSEWDEDGYILKKRVYCIDTLDLQKAGVDMTIASNKRKMFMTHDPIIIEKTKIKDKIKNKKLKTDDVIEKKIRPPKKEK